MALLGSILKRTIKIRKNLPKIRKQDGISLQQNTLRKLLSKAEYTYFGEQYNFSGLLHDKNITETFRDTVPLSDYSSIFKSWWYRTLNGESFVCWPGRIRYFALSSGTSEASSKYIPVSREMMRMIQKTSIRQILTLGNYDLPAEHFEKGMLMLGGSTHLNFNGTYFEGDLSGITTGKIPFWFQHFYKPGKRISKEHDWNFKLEEITKNAKNWDISTIAGVPAWIQILLEKIIDRYQVNSIHDIWPNLRVYVHGGVSISPYKKGFEKLFAKPIIYLETYLASEGFIAYQDRPEAEGMKLVLDAGIYYEFVPFNEENFDEDGVILRSAKALTLSEVELIKDYALLLSTCSGAWRYMIGDTIKFTSLEHHEVVVTGRTKHFLSLCGEHMSQENMNRAVALTSEQMNIHIKEFTVAGIPSGTLFAHKWFLGTDDKVDMEEVKKRIDDNLKDLNDDYRVERLAALKEVIVEVYPVNMFYDWMRLNGKIGAQIKFPRVMKNERLKEWEKYLAENK